ncbi:MAG TPA: glycosyl hydrolase, partial [Thermoanaerobaculia bacterium]|nr:glycosyl hydrolase [Thermoanaerobaculia bacterium]
GGEGSSIWKSTDGGDSWAELTRRPGLPKGTIGISGITVSPSNAQNLYAIIEAEDGGVFRSRDGGATWTKTSESRDLRQRAWYYTRIYADPKNEDVVYVTNVRFHRSNDGGKTFTTIPTPHGDNHDLWIDPDDPLRMIEANDGGANVSFDGGANWTGQDNQPTAQVYRITTDNAFPYRILGAQQDNSAFRIRHRTSGAGIGPRDWEPTAGGESGHIVAKPDNPDIVVGGSYGGYLTIVNHDTGEIRDVNPWPDNPMGAGAADITERFQWNFPILFSPHDPNTLYAASQHLFRSRDMGSSWERISTDLTRNDKSKMGPSGGPITKDNTSVEYYGTIFAVAESKHEPGVIWAGSDDGLIHVTRDGGKTWTNVTPKGMPEWMQINAIEIHPTAPGGLYVAGTRYKLDDFRPYLYRTTDYGKTWTKITTGIAEDHFTRVVRADPVRAGLLFAGTERGMYVSFDDGANWQSLQLDLPLVPITDLTLRDDDLIASTQGRSFWVLDDVTP